MTLTNEEAIATIQEHLRGQDRVLARIEGKVDKTNGRVTALEKQAAVDEEMNKRDREDAAKVVEQAAAERTVRLTRWQLLLVGMGSIAAVLGGVGGIIAIAHG